MVEVQLLSVDRSTCVPGNASIAYSSNMFLSLRHSDIPSSRASAIATNLQLVNLSVGVYSCQFLGGRHILVGLVEMRTCLSPHWRLPGGNKGIPPLFSSFSALYTSVSCCSFTVWSRSFASCSTCSFASCSCCSSSSSSCRSFASCSIATVSSQVTKLCNEYSEIFNGIGKLKDFQVKIHTDESVKPVVQPHIRILFHIRKPVESELERLEKLDIIERVDGPTPWVSPIVVAPKQKNPNEIRLCVDRRLPNKAILRSRHITPTLDDMIFDLNGAKVFSKCDLKMDIIS